MPTEMPPIISDAGAVITSPFCFRTTVFFDLPDWKKTLAAALAYLPEMTKNTALWVSSPAMAQAASELEAETAPAERLGLPGARALRVEAAALAALCGRSAAERLERGLGSAQLERSLILVLPQ